MLEPQGAVIRRFEHRQPHDDAAQLAQQELPQLVQRAATGEVGRLTLAFVSSADYSVLPPFLRAYRAAYPQVQITLQEATSDLQLDDLLHNRIDAGQDWVDIRGDQPIIPMAKSRSEVPPIDDNLALAAH